MSWQSDAKVKARRLALVESLGGRCVDCGTTKNLELDHINGSLIHHYIRRHISKQGRMEDYEYQASQGNLAVRCKFHNQKKWAGTGPQGYD